jgi:hypothetical protein
MWAAFGAMSLAVVATTAAGAQVANRTTYVTFNRSVALPGVELASGDYIFELPLPEQKNLVRVMSRDRRHIYLTAFTTMAERPPQVDPAERFSFHETVGATAPAIKAWFPDRWDQGRHFIYR